jgi:hypothetical protein
MNTSEFWRGYSKCTGRLTWRLATPVDLPAIRRLRTISERFLGQPQRNAPLFSMPVLLTLVAENERGKIVDCVFLEAQVEIAKMACTAESLTELGGLEEDLSKWLRTIGIRTVLATTLAGPKGKMARALDGLGFKCCERVWTYWRRLL